MENGKKYNVQLKADPARVISDGKNEVSIRCAFSHADKKNQKPIREEIPVEFKCKRLKLDEKKTASKGAATIKIKPEKPIGKVKITASTPYGDASASIIIQPTPAQWARDMIQSLVIAFIIAMGIIRPFILATFFIPSGSMENTFYEGDRVIGLKFPYRFSEPQRGDVVIFKSINKEDCKNVNYILFKHTSCLDYIKRLIGTEGDTVEIRGGITYVNGKALREPYLKEPQLRDFHKITVPKGKLFFMGDNRNNSNDSRFWGYLPRERVNAKAWVHFWPPDRVKVIKHWRSPNLK